MNKRIHLGVLFDILNAIFLTIIAVVCIFPLINVFAISFSSSSAATAGKVTLWPIGFNIGSYKFLIENDAFWRAYSISILRLIIGTTIALIMSIVTAYPLAKNKKDFKFRNIYMWIIFFTALFNGGLIPTYMVISSIGLIDKFAVLVLTYVVQPFNIVILINFYKGIPDSLSEAAYLDGASHWKILWNVIVPISKPAITAIILFIAIFHWSSYLDGLIYMNDVKKYPLQTYLQTLIVIKDASSMQHATKEEVEMLSKISDRTTKASQLFLSSLPIIIAYPFLQKHFVKGITLGSVKG